MTPRLSPGPLPFRTISLQEALSAGFRFFFSRFFLWVAGGVFLGVVHHFLLMFLSINGTPVTLSERLLEALFLSSWPLGFAAVAVAKEEEGGNPSFGELFKVPHLFSLTFSMVCLSLLSLGGAMIPVQVFAWFFPGIVAPLSQTLTEPVSVSSGWTLLPLLVLGGMLLGIPYSFGPFVALHEGKGFLGALEKSRFLTRGIRIGIFFLLGFLFVLLCGAFFVCNKIPNTPTFAHHVFESLVIAGTAGLGGAVWSHAYRQAVKIDEEPSLLSPVRGRRIHIPDQPVFIIQDPTERSP